MGLELLLEEPREQASPLSALWGYSEKLAVCKIEGGSYWNPTLQAS